MTTPNKAAAPTSSKPPEGVDRKTPVAEPAKSVAPGDSAQPTSPLPSTLSQHSQGAVQKAAPDSEKKPTESTASLKDAMPEKAKDDGMPKLAQGSPSGQPQPEKDESKPVGCKPTTDPINSVKDFHMATFRVCGPDGHVHLSATGGVPGIWVTGPDGKACIGLIIQHNKPAIVMYNDITADNPNGADFSITFDEFGKLVKNGE